jgi:hypothetical protein
MNWDEITVLIEDAHFAKASSPSASANSLSALWFQMM